jgi:hypothetical protein
VLPAELIGAKVGHVMVHDVQAVYLSDGAMVQCSGAVDIWTEGHVIVLRSSPLYGCPPLSSAMAGRASTGATVTVCSHDEADRLSSRLSPRWEPMMMRSQVIAAFNPDEAAVCLRSCNGQDSWITFRADLRRFVTDGLVREPQPLVTWTTARYRAGGRTVSAMANSSAGEVPRPCATRTILNSDKFLTPRSIWLM